MSKRTTKGSRWWTIARIELAKSLYMTSLATPDEMLRAINEMDADVQPIPKWRNVMKWMSDNKIPRASEAAAMVSIRGAAERDAKIVETIRAMVAEGATNHEISVSIGRPASSLVRIMQRNKIARVELCPQRAKIPGTGRDARPKPTPKFQTAEEWERAGGVVKMLPAAVVAPTQARLSDEDRAQLAAYTAAQGGYDRHWGNWRQQKREGRW